jgi:hypothetical protein
MTAGPNPKMCAWGEEDSGGLYLSLGGSPLVHSVLTPLTVLASGLRNTRVVCVFITAVPITVTTLFAWGEGDST